MKHRLEWLPNLLTMGNLFCGFLAVLFGTRVHENSLYAGNTDYYVMAVVMMLIAGLFDFFDGYIARRLGVSSEVGRELDSLADVVSFGVAPALLLYQRALTSTHWIGIIAAAFYVSCSAWRLARHNVLATRGRQSFFTGMPIEGGAVLLMAVVLSSGRPIPENAVMSPTDQFTIIAALLSIVVAGVLMVCRMRFTANVPWYIRLGALAVMAAAFIWPTQWIFLIPLTYIAYGVICNIFSACAYHNTTDADLHARDAESPQ